LSREVICCPGAAGSKLVIDRLANTLTDQRLVAHLAADEPPENAAIVTSLYLADMPGRHCRRLTAEDLETGPFAAGAIQPVSEAQDLTLEADTPLLDRQGYLYRLQAASIPELRWHKHPHDQDDRAEAVSVREVVGSLESYEPVRSMTLHALAAHACEVNISVEVLRAELGQLERSRIVLNRGLREAVLTAVKECGLTMSEIAVRCGRLKRDSRGNVSGETSWLARRIGRLPEGGQSAPSPWITSETLALIARQGLEISPREVELG
jgi:hypothetical protein